MEAVTLFGITFLPHTWPLVFGLGGLWVASALVMTMVGAFKLLKLFKSESL